MTVTPNAGTSGPGVVEGDLNLITEEMWAGFGNSFLFDGVDDVVDAGADDTGMSGPFCIEAKLYPFAAGGGTSRAICGRWGASAGDCNYFFNIQGSGVLAGGVRGGGSDYYAIGTTVLSADVAYDVCVDYGADQNLRVFLDGVLEATTFVGGLQAPAAGVHMFVGMLAAFAPQRFDGIIDEFRLSNVSRHTANYTPDAEPFESDGDTVVLYHAEEILGDELSRVTQVFVEVASSDVPPATQVTQTFVEVASSETPGPTGEGTGVTQVLVEVATSRPASARVSHVFVEVATADPTGTKVTQTFVEIASSEPPEQEDEEVADDTIATIAFPSIEADGDPPQWVTLRGQDVRAYDFEQERDVYGPLHPFMGPDDAGISNGLIRARFGGQGLVAHATIDVFADDEWRDMGTLYFADPASLTRTMQRVRIARLRPEEVVMALEVRELGPVVVALRRGERMLRITSGSTLAPVASMVRQVRWSGAASGGVSNGLIVGAPDAQDLIRGLCCLSSAVTQVPAAFGLQRTATVLEVGAFVAVDGVDHDEPADHHAQFAADCEQSLGLR